MAAIVPTIAIGCLDHALRFYAAVPGFAIDWVHHRGDMGPARLAGLAWVGVPFVLVDEGCENALTPQATERSISTPAAETLARGLNDGHLASRVTRPEVAWTTPGRDRHDSFGIDVHLFDEDAWVRETGVPGPWVMTSSRERGMMVS